MEKSPVLMYIMNKLREMKKQRGWSYADMANACGWEGGGGRISNYLNFIREPTLADIEKMLNVFHTNIYKILFDNLGTSGYNFQSSIKELPLLDMEELPQWVANKDTAPTRTTRMYIEDADIKEQLLVVKTQGNAMETTEKDKIKKSISDGDIILVKLNVKPEPGNVVLALIDGQVKIREFSTDGTEKFLKAYNKEYDHIPLTKEIKILGVISRKQVSLEKN